MAISVLQHRFISFAKGMPAIAFSTSQIKRELAAMLNNLKGQYPDQPVTVLANIPMPIHDLSYSAFIRALSVRMFSGYAELEATLIATVHRRNRPAEIIREYLVETVNPIKLVFDYNAISRELYWRQDGIAIPRITPSWGADADTVLANTTIPDPKRDNYLSDVETPILWSTKNSFVSLLIDVLPKYPLGEMAPWLSLLEPLRFAYGDHHIIITASRAQIAIGGCTPSTIIVEPDPAFPYGETIPSPTFSGEFVDIAVYLPRTRLIDFVAGTIQPAVLVTSQGGGFIKWAISGAFGIKSFRAEIKTGIVFPSGTTVSGVIGVAAAIDFVGAARAWVDGPSGTKIGLAGGSVLGSGEFAADIRLQADLGAGYISGDLQVTRSELTHVDFDVNTPFGWPLDAIAGEVLDHVAKDEVRKLTRNVVHLGKWEFLGIPLSYLDSLGAMQAFPIMEGLEKVCAYMGVIRQQG